MWELSLLVMHVHIARHTRIVVQPDLSEYHLSDNTSNNKKLTNTPHSHYTRMNSNSQYLSFKKQIKKGLFSKELLLQNKLDLVLYKSIVLDMCKSIHLLGLSKIDIVQTYWKERSILSLIRNEVTGVMEIVELDSCQVVPYE